MKKLKIKCKKLLIGIGKTVSNGFIFSYLYYMISIIIKSRKDKKL